MMLHVFLLLWSVAGMIKPDLTGKPQLVQAGMAAPDVIVLTIRAQSVEHGRQLPYVKQPDDEIHMQGQHRIVVRNGARIGTLAGPEKNILYTPDRVVGDPLDTHSADQVSSYNIIIGENKPVIHPQAVYRKSKPVDNARMPGVEGSGMEHSIVLKLAAPLHRDERCTIRVPDNLLTEWEISYVFDPAQLRSEAVHVNQIGYRPDDPVKLAYLSFWMGSGGNLRYPAGLPFHLSDNKSGNIVYTGKATLRSQATDQNNKTGADVHELDFSGFNRPGNYRISVDGVGCSFPFTIGDGVWQSAFIKSMRGLYCQRNGIALGPPHTTFVRPRGFHPDGGVKVYVSDPVYRNSDLAQASLPEIDYTTKGRFQEWLETLTDQVLPNAWGGWMDAGDWDRRPDHALMPLMMFDLAEMFPENLVRLNFGLPDSDDQLPDLINEALWGVDFLRRMQQRDGSVFAAIESGEHPRRGECSWQESLPIFAYARNRNAAYDFTAVAARAALWFQTHQHADRSQGYRETALKAFEWAEKQQGRDGRGSVENARCLAAAEFYRLTGEARFHEIFLAETRFKDSSVPFYTNAMGPHGDPQGEAGWTYLRTTHPGIDREIQRNIQTALVRDADRDVQNCDATDFHWAGGPERQIRWGAVSVPESHVLCRAHFITGNETYLRAIVLSTQSGAGANPVNTCYTTGIGSRSPQHPLHEDARVSNQPLYEGVTLGGPIDPASPNKHPNAARFERLLYPPVSAWPATESFFDVFSYVPMNEFTVHHTMLPTSFVWGYLAVRRTRDGNEK